MIQRGHLALSAIAACLLAPGCRSKGTASAKAPIRVAAAADLAAAFEELGERFEGETGERLTFSFGSTGQLARQIEQGAPFDVFAAANVSFVDEVVAAKACDGATQRAYARGRIAIWARGEVPRRLADLADARFAHLAIANPEHAPYGMAAKEALGTAGIWDAVRERTVYGENVRQALQFAETGNVEAAIVALSLVIQKEEGSWVLVEEGLHEPIDQAVVACRGGSRFEGGRAFVAYLGSAPGRATMRRYGFLLPGEVAGAP